jgi:hypothetical protein
MSDADLTHGDAIINAVFCDPGVMDRLDHLSPAAMPSGFHQTCWATLQRLHREGVVPDLTNLVERLSMSDNAVELMGDGWTARLMALCDGQRYTATPEGTAHLLMGRMRSRRVRLQAEAALADRHADADTLVESLRAVLEAEEAAANSTGIQAMTAAELDAGDFPLRYLVDGILVEGQPCIVAAPKKSLKTNTMIDLTLSLATGAKFLGEFWTPESRRVAIISGESGKSTIQETARRIAKAKPWRNLADYGKAYFGFDLPNFGDPRSMADLRRFLRRHNIQVLIVDPAYLCLPLGDDAGNLFKVGQVLMPFSKLAADHGVTPVIVHHFVKAATVTEAPPEMESIAWAGFQEWARQWILMSRRSPYDADRPGHHELWFTAGGSAGHSVAKAVDVEEGDWRDDGGRRWDVTVVSIGEAVSLKAEAAESAKEQRQAERDKHQRKKDTESVLAILPQHPDGLTSRQLRDYSGVREPRIHAVIHELVKANTLEACVITGGNGRAYDGYRLATGQRNAAGRSGTESVRPAGEEERDGASPSIGDAVPLLCACPEEAETTTTVLLPKRQAQDGGEVVTASVSFRKASNAWK